MVRPILVQSLGIKTIRISHWNLKIKGIVENSAKVEKLIFDFVNQLNVMDLEDRLPEGLKIFKFEEHFYHVKAEFLLGVVQQLRKCIFVDLNPTPSERSSAFVYYIVTL